MIPATTLGRLRTTSRVCCNNFHPSFVISVERMIREREFQVLSQRHCDEIYRYALGLLGNQTDAEDATQESLLRLWNHLPRLNLFNIRGWLFQTTRNYCLDQLRRRSHAANPNGAGVDPNEI